MAAGAAGGLTAAVLSTAAPRPWLAATPAAISGTLAGLVSASATCIVAPLWTHVPVAAVAAGVAQLAQWGLRKLQVDDATSAAAVHLGGGAVSILAVGFFAEPQRLLSLPGVPPQAAAAASAGVAFGGDGSQLGVQAVWLLFVLGWTAALVLPVCLGLQAFGVLRSPDTALTAGAPLRARCAAAR